MFALPRFWFGGVDVHTHRGYSPGCSVRGCVSLGDMEDNEKMRIVVFEGTKLDRYRCEVCGQVELHTAGENNSCLNCGCLMVKVSPEKMEDPVGEPERKQDQISQKVNPVNEFIPGVTPKCCRYCSNCSGKEGRGNGTKYICRLSGAKFGPNLGCEAFAPVD